MKPLSDLVMVRQIMDAEIEKFQEKEKERIKKEKKYYFFKETQK